MKNQNQPSNLLLHASKRFASSDNKHKQYEIRQICVYLSLIFFLNAQLLFFYTLSRCSIIVFYIINVQYFYVKFELHEGSSDRKTNIFYVCEYQSVHLDRLVLDPNYCTRYP